MGRDTATRSWCERTPSRNSTRTRTKSAGSKRVVPVVPEACGNATVAQVPPHLKSRIELYPFKDILSEKKWGSVEKDLLRKGVHDSAGRLIPPKTKAELELEWPNRSKMIP